jgi:hypothetical protein
MITDALLSILFAFVNLIASIFTIQADVPISNTLTSAITAAAGYYNAMNFIFPFSTMFAIIVFELSFEGIYFIYKLIRWGYNKVPGIN